MDNPQLSNIANWLLFNTTLVKNPTDQLINIRSWTKLKSIPDIQSELRVRTQELELLLDTVKESDYENVEDPTEFPVMFNMIEKITNDFCEFLRNISDIEIERDYIINAILTVMRALRKQELLAEYVMDDSDDISHVKNSANMRFQEWAKQVDGIAFK